MTLGVYCYHNRWVSQPSRLSKLTNVQQQPGPTRNYGSIGARENSIRRRVIRSNNNQIDSYLKGKNKQTHGFGPLFGIKKQNDFPQCQDEDKTEIAYRSNGGTGTDVTYWKRVMVGPYGWSGSLGEKPCGIDSDCDIPEINKACQKIKSKFCVLSGKAWFKKRRGLN